MIVNTNCELSYMLYHQIVKNSVWLIWLVTKMKNSLWFWLTFNFCSSICMSWMSLYVPILVIRCKFFFSFSNFPSTLQFSISVVRAHPTFHSDVLFSCHFSYCHHTFFVMFFLLMTCYVFLLMLFLVMICFSLWWSVFPVIFPTASTLSLWCFPFDDLLCFHSNVFPCDDLLFLMMFFIVMICFPVIFLTASTLSSWCFSLWWPVMLSFLCYYFRPVIWWFISCSLALSWSYYLFLFPVFNMFLSLVHAITAHATITLAEIPNRWWWEWGK